MSYPELIDQLLKLGMRYVPIRIDQTDVRRPTKAMGRVGAALGG
jgi:hypothetical protein